MKFEKVIWKFEIRSSPTWHSSFIPSGTQHKTRITMVFLFICSYGWFAGVFENLTSLNSLDLSGNELAQLPSSNLLRLPQNLSALYLSHNYLTRIPVKVFIKQKFQILDLRDNLLSTFSAEFMKLIENGTNVLYSGKWGQMSLKSLHLFTVFSH